MIIDHDSTHGFKIDYGVHLEHIEVSVSESTFSILTRSISFLILTMNVVAF